MKKLTTFLLILLLAILTACGNNESSSGGIDSEKLDQIIEEDLTPKIEIPETKFEISGVLDRIVESGLGYGPGSYIKGDIPQGEYAFIPTDKNRKYYAEKDSEDNIIDNENFDSFGYVFVHEIGNIETDGYLVSLEALEQNGYSGVKELYEEVNNLEEYSDSAYYKVGKDIPQGQYIVESYNRGYVAVMSGPIGKNDIIDNDNFNGRYSVNVLDGQYLKVSGGYISYSGEGSDESNETETTEITQTEEGIDKTPPTDMQNALVIAFPVETLEAVINSPQKDTVEGLYIDNEVYFTLSGIGELTNLKEIYFEHISVVGYLKELLELPNLQRIYISNTDGDASVESILRKWGLSDSVEFIYLD